MLFSVVYPVLPLSRCWLVGNGSGPLFFVITPSGSSDSKGTGDALFCRTLRLLPGIPFTMRLGSAASRAALRTPNDHCSVVVHQQALGRSFRVFPVCFLFSCQRMSRDSSLLSVLNTNGISFASPRSRALRTRRDGFRSVSRRTKSVELQGKIRCRTKNRSLTKRWEADRGSALPASNSRMKTFRFTRMRPVGLDGVSRTGGLNVSSVAFLFGTTASIRSGCCTLSEVGAL